MQTPWKMRNPPPNSNHGTSYIIQCGKARFHAIYNLTKENDRIIREAWYQQQGGRFSHCFKLSRGPRRGLSWTHNETPLLVLCWSWRYAEVGEFPWFFEVCGKMMRSLCRSSGMQVTWLFFAEIQIEIRTWLRMAGSSYVGKMPQGPNACQATHHVHIIFPFQLSTTGRERKSIWRCFGWPKKL